MKMILSTLSCLLYFLTSMAQGPAQQQRPNIIFFLVDDMGWMDTSLPFGDSVMALNRQFHTPIWKGWPRQVWYLPMRM
ncbi:hypothetical protein [Paraflavitalea speifideaquila]|uniref:hypothetical protein n=1 Tax=Paraflavitalea speifideaquila TaxID=3076558 RepID=UPI0028F02627|nr:hypothetical protein [Paraflavitalea speifideiaquila]